MVGCQKQQAAGLKGKEATQCVKVEKDKAEAKKKALEPKKKGPPKKDVTVNVLGIKAIIALCI